MTTLKGLFLFISLYVVSVGAQSEALFKISPDINDGSIVRVRLHQNMEVKKAENLMARFKKMSRSLILNQRSAVHVDVIAILNMTDYLAGVVSKEMAVSWPLEALKAQAVVARSYTVAKMLERKDTKFDLEGDHMDQVFDWTSSDKAYRAVRETENTVLTSAAREIVKAFYHSDCGGHTVPASLVWPGALDTGTATDSFCSERRTNTWEHRLKKNEISDFSHLKKYKDKILFVGRSSIQRLRATFGFHKIRNSPEQIIIEQNAVVFKGRGFGHGVGLCQWGTRALALKGVDYAKILKHYYPRVSILNLDAEFSKNRLTDYKLNHMINSVSYNQ